MPPYVLRIVFQDFPTHDDAHYFIATNHSLGPKHLAQSVRKKQHSPLRRLPHLGEEIFFTCQ